MKLGIMKARFLTKYCFCKPKYLWISSSLIFLGCVLMVAAGHISPNTPDWIAGIGILATIAGLVVFMIGTVAARKEWETEHSTESDFKTPLLALILAAAGFLATLAITAIVNFARGPATNLSLLDRGLQFFYFPALKTSFLFIPSSWFHKDFTHPIWPFAVFGLFALLQWYLVFFIAISVYRYFKNKSP